MDLGKYIAQWPQYGPSFTTGSSLPLTAYIPPPAQYVRSKWKGRTIIGVGLESKSSQKDGLYRASGLF
jgi:hypothetical protein